MHQIPDNIKEFWERKGYLVEPRFSLSPEGNMLWDVVKDKIIYETIALSFADNFQTIYYWESKEYTEEEMLKIIRLKAFL